MHISEHSTTRAGHPAPRSDGQDPPGAHGAHAVEQNALLRALPADEYARLLPHLEPVELSHAQVLWRADAAIHSVYFPRTAVSSLLTPLADEKPVEAATVGREGFVGTPIVLGARATGVEAIAQIPGTAARLDASRLAEWLRAPGAGDGAGGGAPGGVLFPLLLRYAQALQEQTAQSVACNRRHGIDERCARWLLMTHDRVGADQGVDTFPLTQEFLAFMLGVRRASVTVAAGMLQQAGLIKYSRGRIAVRDRAGLEAASCECYGVVRRKYAQLLGPEAAVG
jgi:CRP-like cAMP-binding protein